ncbi:uncharacterized protein LOC124258392 [Haliotis rubra]|uniref:uncharacterized protein LOC124258392 n=1 Tax=Haliotis rubra TaxID=36100 RepID=UPI001EE53DA2|nr:uncharacterized protein LOC124258392 [Haliotis rubra]
MMKKLVIVLSLFMSVVIAQECTLIHYFVRQNKLNNKKPVETPSNVLHMESQLGCGLHCAQDDTCASLTHLEGQCLLYNSSVLPSDVQAPGARTFIKQGYCPESQGYTSVPLADLCFKYQKDQMYWTASQEQCESEGGRLIILNTMEKRDHIVATLGDQLIYPHIGLQRVGGAVTWTDGSTYLPGQTGIEIDGCGLLYHGSIGTYYCNWNRSSFCEIPV